MHAASSASLGRTPRRITLPTGVELEYVEHGDPNGMVLIFLHGFTDSWRSWEDILPRIAPAYHSYALTQRGHGDSSKPACCYRVADYAGDVLAFMDALKLAQVTLIGHSMGSYIAYQVAGDHPGHVARLVLIGWGPIKPTSPAAAARVFELYQDVQALENAIDPTFVRTFLASTTVNALPARELDKHLAESLKVPLAVWRQMLASRLAADTHPAPSLVTAKTLVLYGDHDVYVREGQQVLATAIPQATFLTYPETGHALHWDAPQRFVDDLHTFLATRGGQMS
jgi:non-heme chloroperoxidase